MRCTEFEFWDLLKLFKGSEVQAAIRDCRKIIKAQYGEVQYADMRVDPTPKVAQSRHSQALSKKVCKNQPDPAQQEQEEQPTDSDADVFDEEEDEGETNDVAGQSQQQAA